MLGREMTQKNRKNYLEFLDAITSHRPALFRFCRHLTDNLWDAEDLVQETLAKAWSRLPEAHMGVDNPRSYLFKMASNQWIDWCRKQKRFQNFQESERQGQESPDKFGELSDSSPELLLSDALRESLSRLPPRECLVFVLREGVELSLEETSEICGLSLDTVKSLLYRARKRIQTLSQSKPNQGQPKEGEEVRRINAAGRAFVDKVSTAFNRRDLKALESLISESATSNAYGCFFESGRDQIMKGSLFHTVNLPDGTPQPDSMVAKTLVLEGETLFTLWEGEKLSDVWLFEATSDRASHFECYYCSPDVLKAVAELIGCECVTHGYYYGQKKS